MVPGTMSSDGAPASGGRSRSTPSRRVNGDSRANSPK